MKAEKNTTPAAALNIFQADTGFITELSLISAETFHETFSSQNKKEDMEKYIREKFSHQHMAKELADSGNKFFVAMLDDRLVGYAKLRAADHPRLSTFSRSIEIERLYVLKPFHKMKIGASLMQFCIDYSKSHLFETIWLGVWEFNQRAIHFYERWGFEKFGDHEFILGTDRQTDILMKKNLAA
jgi:ribosomal protein S18 acetylase RimI-like enzyme